MTDETTARAIRAGLLTWPLAGVLYLLHITMPRVIGSTALDLVDIFLMGIGCVALHAAAIRSPRVARWLSPRVLVAIATAAGACAVMAAIMITARLFHPANGNMLVGQMMLQAPAVISLISLDTRRAIRRSGGQRERLLTALESFNDMTIGQLENLVEAAQAILAVRCVGEQTAPALRVVPFGGGPGGSARGGAS